MDRMDASSPATKQICQKLIKKTIDKYQQKSSLLNPLDVNSTRLFTKETKIFSSPNLFVNDVEGVVVDLSFESVQLMKMTIEERITK